MRCSSRFASGFSLFAVAVAAVTGLALAADPPAKKVGPDPKEWGETVEKGRAYLKARQADDGSFRKEANPGITAVAVVALCRTGDKADATVLKSLKFIEGQIDEKDGSIFKGAKSNLANYLTSINVQALAEADPKKYDATLKKAAAFLIALQFDEKKEKKPSDVFYGGVGYDGKLRPDLSNTSMTVQAVAAAGVSRTDPFFKKAAVYVSRCQNAKGEHNDQPWAGKIDDGSFTYAAGPAAERMYNSFEKDAVKPTDPHPGYGSMTVAGLLCLDLCGVGTDDPRVKKGFKWVGDEFTTDCNPGFDGPLGGCGGWGHYYYLAHLAKYLDRLGVDEVTDRKGRKRDWRAEVTRALAERQRKDGSWQNESDAFLESIPEAATGWALIALSHCKPKTK